MTHIGPLYHWSPKSRREAILREGLRLLSGRVVHSAGRFAYLCFGVTPSAAWGLSGGFLDGDGEEESWDLWQVNLADTDEVRINPQWGGRIAEVRLYNSVPADRVWWAGERTEMAHETMDIPENVPDATSA